MLIQALLLNEAIYIRLSFMSGFAMVCMYGCRILEMVCSSKCNKKKRESVDVRVLDGKNEEGGILTKRENSTMQIFGNALHCE